ncbi:MAG: gliding motility-associated C-terminal domain-containing protein [Ferruginibacter sp.]
MKRFFLFLLFVTLHFSPFAQPVSFVWAKQFGGTGTAVITKTLIDAAGNIYVTGDFMGTVDFDPGPGVSNLTASVFDDGYVMKLNSSGALIWLRHFSMIGSFGDNIPQSAQFDPSGALNIAIQYSSPMDADPGPGVYPTGTISGAEGMVLVRLDANGNFINARNFGPGGNLGVTDFTIDASGNYLLTGLFQQTVDFDPGPVTAMLTSFSNADIFILKLDANADFLWVKRLIGDSPASNQSPGGIATDASGNIYYNGAFDGVDDMDPGPASYLLGITGKQTSFISKLDAGGNFLWAKGITTSPSQPAAIYSGRLRLNSSNDIYFCGYFSGTLDFDPGPGITNLSAAGNNDVFYEKLDKDGNFNWVRQLGGTGQDGVYDFTLDKMEDAYITGAFSASVDFDPGPGTHLLTSNGSSDCYALKFDKDGNYKWAEQIGGTAGDLGTSITVDNNGNIYTSGFIRATADMDPSAAVFNIIPHTSAGDAFMQKLFHCISPLTSSFAATACDSYTWNGQHYTASGVYTQQFTSSSGCDSIVTLTLTVNNTKFTSIDTTICEGRSVFAQGAQQTRSGNYRDTLHSAYGCDSIIITRLTVLPFTQPALGPDGPSCSGTSKLLLPGNYASYLWQDNSTGPTFSVITPGLYWVKVGSVNGCQATDSIRITALDTLPTGFLPDDQAICFGRELRITVPGYKSYLWSNGSTGSSVALTALGTYYLSVVDFNDCAGKDSIHLSRAANCIPLSIPGAFTPDNNGKNDVFRPIIGQDLRSFSMKIFNRYGELLFESHDPAYGWDGNSHGVPQKAGTYVYHLTVTNITGYTYDENGTVILIR